jgi:mono/diheme cytochrome c family protein
MRRIIWGTGAVALSFLACQPTRQEVARDRVAQLNQGWSQAEVEFYNHANEGTNLAPLDFFLNLPDRAKPGAKFVDRLVSAYGFIPSPKSELNPHGLPVGFALDERWKATLGERVYVGINCAACHTRRLTYSKGADSWTLPVHGGPAMIDFPRFKQDLYDTFFAVAKDDALAREFAKAVLGKDADDAAVAAIRAEIAEFTGPVAAARSVLEGAKVAQADFGPGNLNALSQGNYNNAGLGAWLAKKGFPLGGGPPMLPKMEGAANYPPMWFAPHDTWAQWFVEIHHAGPRNWVQSLSTSEVRPPKLVAAAKQGALFASIHFENIQAIQSSLERLRTPKWPEEVFGPINRSLAAEGRAVYQERCAACHTRSALAPNQLGIVFKERPAFDVGTDPTAYQQFVESGPDRLAGLQKVGDKLIDVRREQLQKDPRVGPKLVGNYMNLYSRGLENKFAVAKEYDEPKAPPREKSGASYWASPLEGVFASAPYFHNGSVRTLWEVLTDPKQREKSFKTGSVEFDVEGVGLRNDGPFTYNTAEPGKGNGGHPFGTDLPKEKKAALIEYMKSI